jgi:hypothetical protein
MYLFINIYSNSINKQYEKSLIDIQETILHLFTPWINQQSWNNRIIFILRQISFSIQLNRYLILKKQFMKIFVN